MSTNFFAAIGSDLMAVYGVGETEEAAVADARRESGEADAAFEAVPMTTAAADFVRNGANGGAPSTKLVVSRAGVSLREEE